MQTNWSTTTTQVNIEELVAIQDKLRRKCESEFLTKLPSVFMPLEPLKFEWLKPPLPQTPEAERMDAMKFRVFNDLSVNFGVPKRIIFGCDTGGANTTFVAYESVVPKNKWLRIATLVIAVIIFGLIWSGK